MEEEGFFTTLPSLKYLSDHSPIMLTLPPQMVAGKTRRLRFDPGLLKIPTFKADFLEAWNETPPRHPNSSYLTRIVEAFESVRSRAKKISAKFKSNRFKAKRRAINKINAAQSFLTTNLGDEGAQVVMDMAQSELEELSWRKVERNHNEMAALWFNHGDKCTKTFFNYHKSGHFKVHIPKLLVDGSTIST